MEVLGNLRQKLKETQDPSQWENVREEKRRTGRVELKSQILKCKRCSATIETEEDKPPETRCSNCYAKDNVTVPLIKYTPGPYTLKFRKEYLEELLEGQTWLQEEGPDPNITLILEEEIHEIQRIWRMEQGDWQNTAYQIYEKVTGIKLETVKDDLGGFGQTEQKLLEQVCTTHNVPFQLVSTLLNVEFETQGGTRHSKVFGKIKTELKKEWRDTKNSTNMSEILQELDEERKDFHKVKPVKNEYCKCGHRRKRHKDWQNVCRELGCTCKAWEKEEEVD